MRRRTGIFALLALLALVGVLGIFGLPSRTPAHDPGRRPVAPVPLRPPDPRVDLRLQQPDAAAHTHAPEAWEIDVLDQAIAEIGDHVLVRCFVGDEYDLDFANFYRGAIRDGWFQLLTTELEGIHTHTLPTEPFTVRWKADHLGEVVPCTVEHHEFGTIELRVVDLHGAPVQGALASREADCPDAGTGPDGRLRCQIRAGVPATFFHFDTDTSWEPEIFEVPALQKDQIARPTFVVEVSEGLAAVTRSLLDATLDDVRSSPEVECASYRRIAALRRLEDDQSAAREAEQESARRRREAILSVLERHQDASPFLRAMATDLARIQDLEPVDPPLPADLQARLDDLEDQVAEMASACE